MMLLAVLTIMELELLFGVFWLWLRLCLANHNETIAFELFDLFVSESPDFWFRIRVRLLFFGLISLLSLISGLVLFSFFALSLSFTSATSVVASVFPLLSIVTPLLILFLSVFHCFSLLFLNFLSNWGGLFLKDSFWRFLSFFRKCSDLISNSSWTGYNNWRYNCFSGRFIKFFFLLLSLYL